MPSFTKPLEDAIHRALALANARRHELATLEHLLLSLIDEPEAAGVMKACGVDLEALRTALTHFIDEELETLVSEIEGSEAAPTTGFQRVIQRAAIHVQSSGRSEVTGANVLVAIFAERESHAAFFLQEQDMTRYDAVNYISHGVAKDPAYGETRPVRGAEETEERDARPQLMAPPSWRPSEGEVVPPIVRARHHVAAHSFEAVAAKIAAVSSRRLNDLQRGGRALRRQRVLVDSKGLGEDTAVVC